MKSLGNVKILLVMAGWATILTMDGKIDNSYLILIPLLSALSVYCLEDCEEVELKEKK